MAELLPCTASALQYNSMTEQYNSVMDDSCATKLSQGTFTTCETVSASPPASRRLASCHAPGLGAQGRAGSRQWRTRRTSM